VDFVRKHYRKIGSEERQKNMNRLDLEARLAHIEQYEAKQRWIKSRTLHRVAPSVGRNDPCPCGSGKKFKKCCGR